jgi:dTMP kinase
MNNSSPNGLFFAFEGIDGSGKSTQSKLLYKQLANLGLPCHMTKEPTDSPIGSVIRQIMTGRVKTDNKVIAALFVADRLDHLLNDTDGMVGLLKRGISVISDRYYFSSYAYHSVDVDMEWVIQANSISAEILRPTLTIYLDIDSNTALERMMNGRTRLELFEERERLLKVRELYFEAFDRLEGEEKVVVVDCNRPKEETAAAIWSLIEPIAIKHLGQ